MGGDSFSRHTRGEDTGFDFVDSAQPVNLSTVKRHRDGRIQIHTAELMKSRKEDRQRQRQGEGTKAVTTNNKDVISRSMQERWKDIGMRIILRFDLVLLLLLLLT